MGHALDDEKALLRRELFQRRKEAAANAPEAGRYVAERIARDIPLPIEAPISGFWPMGSEIDIRPLLEKLNGKGHPVGLPVVARKSAPLIFRRWQTGDNLISGGFGTSIPDPNQPEIEPRVLFVPLLAFDRQGYRLGYGGGFYDRTLERLRRIGPRLAVGVAFAAQEVAEVPRDRYDQKLDVIVTEREVISIDMKKVGRT